MQGHEICDCQRANGLTTENRYFEHKNVRIAYNQIFGPNSDVLINDLESLNQSSCKNGLCQQTGCLPGDCGSMPTIRNLGSILKQGTLQEVFGLFSTSDIIFNAGHWWMSDEKISYFHTHQKRFVDEIEHFKNSSRIPVRFHWKMTTGSASNSLPEMIFAKRLLNLGVINGIFDSLSITQHVYKHFPEMLWDHLHFEPPVYVGLNQAFIGYICSMDI